MLKKVEKFRAASTRRRFHRRVIRALALNKGREARSDGLSLNHFQNRLQIEWSARDVHPWDRDLPPPRVAQLFAEQCLKDADSAIQRLFAELPEIDVLDFTMLEFKSGARILCGAVTRNEAMIVRASSSGMRLKQLGVTYCLQNWRFEPLVEKAWLPNPKT
jgi:hypothetical protein